MKTQTVQQLDHKAMVEQLRAYLQPLDEAEAAEVIGTSHRTLRRHRLLGWPVPHWSRRGTKIVYLASDVMDFLANHPGMKLRAGWPARRFDGQPMTHGVDTAATTSD